LLLQAPRESLIIFLVMRRSTSGVASAVASARWNRVVQDHVVVTVTQINDFMIVATTCHGMRDEVMLAAPETQREKRLREAA
jgi:hypothetical protein